jgi:hypothetical protein
MHASIFEAKETNIEREVVMSKNLTPLEVVLAWHNCYSKRDVDGALKYMSEDFKRYGDSNRWTASTKATWGAEQRGFFEAYPDWSWDLTSITASGELVCCEFLEHGTFTRPYRDINRIVGMFVGREVTEFTLEPTGESYYDYNSDFLVVRDGLIVELRAYITNNLDRTFHFEKRVREIVASLDPNAVAFQHKS